MIKQPKLDRHLSFYDERIRRFTDELNVIKKRIIWISNLRILVALATVALLYAAIQFETALLYLIPIPVFAFVILVVAHNKCFKQKQHLENLIEINRLEIQAVEGNYSGYSPGLEFLDIHHPYAHDLDIFGEGSLYQCLNRANTLDGRKAMAERLTGPTLSKKDVLSHQEAVRELTEQVDFRQHFQAAGLEIGEQPQDRDELLAWLQLPPIFYGKRAQQFLLHSFPPITIAAVITAFFVPGMKPVAILMALTQWGILGYHSKRIRFFHEFISRKKIIIDKYAHLLSHLSSSRFHSPIMSSLSAGANQADIRLKKLTRLVSALNARLNAMTSLIVNSLLLYDIQCVYRLERWKHENADNLPTWLGLIRNTEVLSSLGTFAFNHPQFAYPIVNDNISVRAKNMGHPLIAESENVRNDLLLDDDQRILIVTGANMAGKSTFLRCVGVNLVLAMSGSVVNASVFEFPIIGIRSGMRTTDSLKDHQSYFYAELNRLKSIVDELRTGKPLLLLLDEILKGTNSTDKQIGSIALVKQLVQYPCLAMVATHDLALGALSSQFPNKVRNFCFEASIENDKLSFDYRLKDGIAQQMNATFLMKKMGIIPPDDEG